MIYLVAIAKNEKDYIKEFVIHHLSIGVDKVIIYDNNSIDGESYDELLSDEVSSGSLDIINVRGLQGQQLRVYKDAYDRHKNEEGWMIFIDVDEFLFLNGCDIKELFSSLQFNNAKQVLFNWHSMNDNGLVRYDNRPLVERFTQYTDVGEKPCGCTGNRHVKCCLKLNPSYNPRFSTSHSAQNMTPCMDSTGKLIYSPSQNVGPFNANPDYSIAEIRHYHFKTIEEFVKNKMTKGFADFQRNSVQPYLDFFNRCELTKEKIEYLVSYIQELEQRIAELQNKSNYEPKNNYLRESDLTKETANSLLSRIFDLQRNVARLEKR